jgi:hypothetical protein
MSDISLRRLSNKGLRNYCGGSRGPIAAIRHG